VIRFEHREFLPDVKSKRKGSGNGARAGDSNGPT